MQSGSAAAVPSRPQYIKFQLDESGAALESRAEIVTVKLASVNTSPDSPRQFLFDRPLLLALRQADAEAPCFLLWVANTELVAAADDAPCD